MLVMFAREIGSPNMLNIYRIFISQSAKIRIQCAFLAALTLCSVSFSTFAIERPEEVIDRDIGIFTELGQKVDLSRPFTNVNGETRALKDFAIPGKPIVIAPVYYKCPRLCGLLLDGVYNLLNEIPLKLVDDFSVLVVGFDPSESPQDAAKVMNKFNAKLMGVSATRTAAIQYLVGAEEQVKGLMGELGFKYARDGADFAHSAALMILTPMGEISQYFTGIIFSPWDTRLALVEASKGEIGTAIDHLLLYCFRFDPLQGRYTWAVVGLLRIGGALTLIGLALVYIFCARKRRAESTGLR
jgi:protein SCO1/2